MAPSICRRGALIVNAKVQYRCNVGYTLMGPTERICPARWILVPLAAVVHSTIANCAVDVPPRGVAVITKVHYQCNAGYTFFGTTERTCQANESRSNAEPTCQGLNAQSSQWE
ncbi:hypothetical protein MRX96_014534 [Rhipicephalus microplus]